MFLGFGCGEHLFVDVLCNGWFTIDFLGCCIDCTTGCGFALVIDCLCWVALPLWFVVDICFEFCWFDIGLSMFGLIVFGLFMVCCRLWFCDFNCLCCFVGLWLPDVLVVCALVGFDLCFLFTYCLFDLV